MGLAATQTRFLSLTARKSNIEYQGQQINQQRTVLSNKSANTYSSMLTLAVPVPPSSADYTNIKYKFTDKSTGVTYEMISYDKDTKAAQFVNTMNSSDTVSGIVTVDVNTNRSQFVNVGGTDYALTVYEETDKVAYEDAYNQYLYKQYLYEQEVQSINAKTEVIQQQDKALELQLKQLDTEESELKTELEALDKILDNNVEGSYKSFGG